MSKPKAVAIHLRRTCSIATAVAMSMLLAAPAIGAEPESPALLVQPLPEFEWLDQFDTLLDGRNRMEWSVRNETREADIFGRSLVDYANQYVFTEATEARFRDLRVRAGTQKSGGARSGYKDTLKQAREALDFEAYRVAVLFAQRDLSKKVTAHETALKGFLDKAPEAEQQRTRARLSPMLDQARASTDSLMRIGTLDELQQAFASDPANALPRVYNEERMRLAPIATSWDREHGVKPMSRTRTLPCNPLYPRPSTTGKPQIEQSTLTEPDYPPQAHESELEGVVHIRADISAKGCADRMEIARSSGVEPLDSAALAWAEKLRFHPAAVNGEAQPASYTFAVTFKLGE